MLIHWEMIRNRTQGGRASFDVGATDKGAPDDVLYDIEPVNDRKHRSFLHVKKEWLEHNDSSAALIMAYPKTSSRSSTCDDNDAEEGAAAVHRLSDARCSGLTKPIHLKGCVPTHTSADYYYCTGRHVCDFGVCKQTICGAAISFRLQ